MRRHCLLGFCLADSLAFPADQRDLLLLLREHRPVLIETGQKDLNVVSLDVGFDLRQSPVNLGLDVRAFLLLDQQVFDSGALGSPEATASSTLLDQFLRLPQLLALLLPTLSDYLLLIVLLG